MRLWNAPRWIDAAVGAESNALQLGMRELSSTGDTSWGFGTKAVHSGQSPDLASGAIMTPVYQSSTYVQEGPGLHKGYEYGRVSNPTRTALEANLAAMEGAAHGIAFSSGVAAADAILKCLRPGDHIICSSDIYGGNYRLMTAVYGPMGLSVSFVDLTDSERLQRVLLPHTRLIWLESPGNPLLNVIDIEAVALAARARNITVVLDNTFATPYLQQPLSLGADLVLHSTTKYIGGHSDVIGGAVCTNRDDWAEKLRFQVKCAGAVPGPMDCFLLLRGCKTLHLRMARHCANARHLAAYLEAHPSVAHVYYPGLPSHPGHVLAARQMSDFGGMISFNLRGDSMEATMRVLTGTRLFALAESLGGVESLIGHPASMTHASIPHEERLAMGLRDSLIRLSVGIEDVLDLEADLGAALSKV